MSKETGGHAFPQLELDRISGQTVDQHFGVTMRDYFAAKAMQGWMVGTEHPHAENMAKTAYQVADAMLIERVK